MEQVRSLTGDPENRKRLIDKVHTSDGKLAPFGRLASEHLTGGKDLEIYNDGDFYQTLLKDFLASNESGNHQVGG